MVRRLSASTLTLNSVAALAATYDAYERLMRTTDRIDFGDQVTLALTSPDDTATAEPELDPPGT